VKVSGSAQHCTGLTGGIKKIKLSGKIRHGKQRRFKIYRPIFYDTNVDYHPVLLKYFGTIYT
jgi:hypothetical protein